MNVNPKETAAFANILGKLDGVKKGETVVDVAAGNQKRLADNDMSAILGAFASTSGTQSALTLTPGALTESATPKQDPLDVYNNDRLATPQDTSSLYIEQTEVQEDSLGDIKSRLSDYLSDIKAADDKDLVPKKPQEDHLGKPIKTMKINGKTVKLHGNEDDGFRLKVNDKLHSATFQNLEQALMACEAYMNRGK